jgi:esterase/lipase superfamily enzyme
MRRLSDHFLHRCKLAVVFLSQAACSPNDDDQQPTERVAAETVSAAHEHVIRRTVPFITLRNKTGSTVATEYFGGERGQIHTGYCEVSWTPIPMLEPLANNMPFYVPHRTIKLETIDEVTESSFWHERPVVAAKDRPLLYIHGYNIGFEKSCSRAAIFQEKLGLTGRLVLLSWPSNDMVLHYTHDEADIYWSVADIERTLERMLSLFSAGNFDLVGHSRGTRGAFLALVRMSAAHRTVINDLDQLLNGDKSASDRTGLRQDFRMGPNYWRLFAQPAN